MAGFVVEGVLGAGGMGVVYAARHPRLKRVVALKVLNDAFAADSRARTAFEREAALAARLDHPNIVTVHDRSEPEDPALWLAMAHIRGGDASALLADFPGGLAAALAVDLIVDAAAALDFAHAQGVLHRDVKPGNLLIETDPRVGRRALLTDFGIARTLDSTVTLSAISVSFAYAAPERFTRQPADHRSDIYSLGATLHHLLTGRPPFPREDQAAVIGAHLAEPPPEPSKIRPELPTGLDTVIATALAKNPEHRYLSCGALAAAAREALDTSKPPTVSSAPIPRTVSVSEPTAHFDHPATGQHTDSNRRAVTVRNESPRGAGGDEPAPGYSHGRVNATEPPARSIEPPTPDPTGWEPASVRVRRPGVQRRAAMGAVALLLVVVVVVVVRFLAASGEGDTAEGTSDFGPIPTTIGLGPIPTTAEPTTASTTPFTTVSRPPQPVDKTTPVRVLNNSMVPGLAGRAVSTLGADGWTNVASGNGLYSGNGTLNRTTVFYGTNSAREKAAAEYLAAQFGGIIEPRPADLGYSGVFVVLTGTE
ncbi:protein kinase domain-containing protein [Nocardia takedensis]